jgi:hypothetical protein
LVAHGKLVSSFIGLRPGNSESIPAVDPPETLSENTGIAKGEDDRGDAMIF